MTTPTMPTTDPTSPTDPAGATAASGAAAAQPRRRRAAAMTSERRREAIITAVEDAVVDAEMDLTTKELARLSGVAEGTLFRVFGSKEELLVAAFTHRLERLALDDSWKEELGLDASDGTAGEDLAARLTERIARYIAVIADRIDTWAGMMGILHRFLRSTEASKARSLRESSRPEMRRIQHLYMGALGQFVDGCRGLLAPYADRLRIDPDEAVAFIQSTATALALGRRYHDFGITPERAADIVVHGIAVPPAA
ncbi:helix-turn-helix transcriptional regulator [Bifidobacterium pullorum subsp. saeculare]|uniref:Helix-turn-helix transcriptional regulator n=1 Tax=Bifidobacterium pullorum subsp. saeculare TaxID=78257 RepID=A0A938WWV0_9BIFI|nr:helix-turn-helix domain-containing protein [Bifidobacterium pullorum]MBM6699376.1 helix-turn-helix transcriptional regulator [Bifidobacterium pullorum subsp. saeculare]